jgi:hypothetical protein
VGWRTRGDWKRWSNLGIARSTNRKNRVLRVRDLNLWRAADLRSWAYWIRWNIITHWTEAAATVLSENAATKSQRIG